MRLEGNTRFAREARLRDYIEYRRWLGGTWRWRQAWRGYGHGISVRLELWAWICVQTYGYGNRVFKVSIKTYVGNIAFPKLKPCQMPEVSKGK